MADDLYALTQTDVDFLRLLRKEYNATVGRDPSFVQRNQTVAAGMFSAIVTEEITPRVDVGTGTGGDEPGIGQVKVCQAFDVVDPVVMREVADKLVTVYSLLNETITVGEYVLIHKDGNGNWWVGSSVTVTGNSLGDLVYRYFVTSVKCVNGVIIYTKSLGLAPITTVLSVTVQRETVSGFTPVNLRLVSAACEDNGPTITGTTKDGVAVLRIPAGKWSITVALLSGETAKLPYPASFTAPEYIGTLGTGSVTITIIGEAPVVTTTGTPPVVVINITPPSGKTIASSTTTIDQVP